MLMRREFMKSEILDIYFFKYQRWFILLKASRTDEMLRIYPPRRRVTEGNGETRRFFEVKVNNLRALSHDFFFFFLTK